MVSRLKKFVVCSKCHHLYHFENCTLQSGEGEHELRSTRFCDFVRFPNHPHKKHRSACSTALLKTLILPSGRQLLYPRVVYPYMTLQSSLQEFLLRPGFVDLCNHWKTLSPSTFARDVYDGEIWRNFQEVDGQPFLSCSDSLSLGLMLNVDWFQPYKHCSYSVGAIYLTIMNLPRSV